MVEAGIGGVNSMRELHTIAPDCRLDCDYCGKLGFLAPPAARRDQAATRALGRVLAIPCNAAFARDSAEMLTAVGGIAASGSGVFVHSRLSDPERTDLLGKLARANLVPLFLVDRPGFPWRKRALAAEALGLRPVFVVLARRTFTMGDLLAGLPEDLIAQTELFFPDSGADEFFLVDEAAAELALLAKAWPEFVPRAFVLAGANRYFASLSPDVYREDFCDLGRGRWLRYLLRRAYRGGMLYAPLRLLFGLAALLGWLLLDTRQAGDFLAAFGRRCFEAGRRLFWNAYHVAYEGWGALRCLYWALYRIGLFAYWKGSYPIRKIFYFIDYQLAKRASGIHGRQ